MIFSALRHLTDGEFIESNDKLFERNAKIWKLFHFFIRENIPEIGQDLAFVDFTAADDLFFRKGV